jgi:ubiquinone/menaquinone biosynthesis C-methylase UbiE
MHDPEDNSTYFEITRDAFALTLEDPASVSGTAELASEFKGGRVLDVGCGVGQALFPLAVLNDATGVGVDLSHAACRTGREFYAERLPSARVTFVRAACEALPFESGAFDLVNCALALPYMDNRRALGEMARVLKGGGLLLLRIHHARFYAGELLRAARSLDTSMSFYFARVLFTGAVYHLFRRQPPRVRFLDETFQTEWLLRRELARHGLRIERRQPGSNPRTPTYVIRKRA